MLVHIEGSDLTWKSTLIDKIQLLFKNVTVFSTPKDVLPRKNSKQAREKIWNYYIRRAQEAYDALKQNPNQIILLDRFFLSELVYGKVIRWYDSSDIKPLMNNLIQILMKIDDEFGYGIIYLSDDTESIWKRFQVYGDDYIKDKKHFHNIKWEYLKRLEGIREMFKVLDINTFKDNNYWDQIIEEMLLHDYKYVRK